MLQTMRAAIAAPLLLMLAQPFARAGDGPAPAPETWNAHVQTTWIWQDKPAFSAAFSGPNSLRAQHEAGYSLSATAGFGLRAWDGGELYLDPEVVQGKAFSGLHGLGGMPNGEQQKTSGPNPTLYRARLFLRQTWNLGGELQPVASDMNQLAGSSASRRLVLTAGNLAASDLFDNNAYAHDARSQFMNWALLAHGAWDFAADARGYSWGAALEYVDGGWAARAGRFLMPKESNGLPLDHRAFVHYGDQVEAERALDVGGLPGKVRLLAFHDRARMGGFDDARRAAQANGGAPDVAGVRRERGKSGFGINVEQQLAADGAGVFARASCNDGRSETYAFAEIDRSLSAGATLPGTGWERPQDNAGVALVRNGLSRAHRAYLAAGGLGAFLGDGGIDYRPESIMEAYYRIDAGRGVQLALDAQRIANPGYDAARGPVAVISLRLHAQY